MSTVNKVILIGFLGKDPEVRYTPDGTAVANLSIATNRNWKDKTSGERQQETEWHRVVAYDQAAEFAGQYLRKGASVYIEGRLKTRKWTDKGGVDHYTTEIIASILQGMSGKRDDEDEAPAPAPPRAPAPAQRAQSRAPAPSSRPATSFDDLDEDPPF